MKAIKILVMLILCGVINTVKGQDRGEVNLSDSTGLPGDHFSLQGALEMFKQSKSIEDFEKRLNQKDNSVNNLDLDGNGKTDYVKVNDISKENAHALVLQIAVSKTENQDIAVIEIEKKGDASAMLQIVGDSVLYPKNTIVEPVEASEPADNGNSKRGPSAYSSGVSFVFVNVWGWPCVRYIYAPVYVAWVSPWYWGFYPPWWSPWAPVPWQYHYMSCYHYHDHYHYAPHHYTTYAHGFYAPRRSASMNVTNRYHENHVRYQERPTTRKHTGAVNLNRSNQPVRPSSGTTSRPQQQPAMSRPESRPIQAPASQPQSRPTTAPSKPTQAKPSVSPSKQPTVKPAPKPQSKPQVRPNNHSKQSRPVSPPGGKSR